MKIKWHGLSPVQRLAMGGVAAAVAAGFFLCLSGMIVAVGLHEWDGRSMPWLAWLRHLLFPTRIRFEHQWLVLGGLVPAAILLALAVRLGNILTERELHGSARPASERDIRKAGLRGKDGLMLAWTGTVPRRYGAAQKNKPYRWKSGHLNAGNIISFGGTEHMCLYAPTRSGKGVGLVIPGLLTWTDSTVVLDMKGENHEKTAGYRYAMGQSIFVFDPVQPEGRTARYNPLAYVRRGTVFQIDDLQRVAAFLFPVSERNPFFDLSARQAFIAVGSFLADTPSKPFTIGQIFRELTASPDMKAHLLSLTQGRSAGADPLSEGSQRALADFCSNSDEVMGNIRATVTSRLNLWLNPLIDAATSANDFDFGDLRKTRMSIYFAITPDNLGRLSAISNLFFQQCLDVNMRELPEHNPALKYKVAFFLDEFKSIGKIEVLKDGAAFVAGYNLRLFFIIQAISQLDEVYGVPARKGLLENCGIEMVFPPKSQEAAKELSDRIGYYTVKGRSHSKTPGKAASESTSDQRRALYLPQELLEMDDKKALILRQGIPVIMANKVRYYAEDDLMARVMPPPPIPTIAERSQSLEGVASAVVGMQADIAALAAARAANQAAFEAQRAEILALKEELAARDRQVKAVEDAGTAAVLQAAPVVTVETPEDVTRDAVIHTYGETVAGLLSGQVAPEYHEVKTSMDAEGKRNRLRGIKVEDATVTASPMPNNPPRKIVAKLGGSMLLEDDTV